MDYEDRQVALDIFAKHAKHHPDVKPPGIRRDFDYLFLGSMIGGGTGVSLLIFAIVSSQSTYAPFLMIGAILTLCGGIVGHLIDRQRKIISLFGRFQLTVVDYLLLMGACATICSLLVL